MAQRVVIEVRTTGIQAYSAVAFGGRYAATRSDRDEAIISVQHQIPMEHLSEGEPEIVMIPDPEPTQANLFEDADGRFRPCS